MTPLWMYRNSGSTARSHENHTNYHVFDYRTRRKSWSICSKIEAVESHNIALEFFLSDKFFKMTINLSGV